MRFQLNRIIMQNFYKAGQSRSNVSSIGDTSIDWRQAAGRFG